MLESGTVVMVESQSYVGIHGVEDFEFEGIIDSYDSEEDAYWVTVDDGGEVCVPAKDVRVV